jgi:dienelactone hydrolase
VNEHPIFVPFEGEHISAVITTPDGVSDGLVLMLQGAGGAPRSHRYRLWVRTARALADRGIASIRMDYLGIGDSTGTYRSDMDAPPLDQATSMATLGLRWTGTERLGVVGNCIGARTALALAASMEACASVACILPSALGPVLQRQGRPNPVGAAAMARRVPTLKRAARRSLGAARLLPRLHFVDHVHGAALEADLLFVHGGNAQSRVQLQRGVAELDTTRRAEVSFLPSEGIHGLRPLETQRFVIDSVARWMAQSLVERASLGSAHEPAAGPAS